MRVSSHTLTMPSRSSSCARILTKRAPPWGSPTLCPPTPQLLAEKRIGFLLLTVGLVLYLSGVVSKSAEGAMLMGTIAGGVVIAGVVTSLVFTRVVGARVREQAREAAERGDPDALPEQ